MADLLPQTGEMPAPGSKAARSVAALPRPTGLRRRGGDDAKGIVSGRLGEMNHPDGSFPRRGGGGNIGGAFGHTLLITSLPSAGGCDRRTNIFPGAPGA